MSQPLSKGLEKSQKNTILVVDDEESLAKMVKKQLEIKGYRVKTAANGADALEKLKEFTPDLILLDMNMPVMSGLEFYEKICDITCKPMYPVLVLTARANMEQLFKDFIVDGFMTKPFKLSDLLDEIKVVLTKKGKIKKDQNDAKGRSKTKHVFIAENEASLLQEIGPAFLNEGYIVSSASNGATAIEKIMLDHPDIALIKLSLGDISGDIVIQKLQHMSKTADIGYILYDDLKNIHNVFVAENMSKKGGGLLKYTHPKELLEAVVKIHENSSH